MKENFSEIRCSRCRVKPPVDGKKRCRGCIDHGISYKAQKCAVARTNGICVKCLKEPVNGAVVCAACNKRSAQNSMKIYDSRKAEGLCVVCGSKNNTKTLKCSSCLTRINQAKRELAAKRIDAGFCSHCFKVPVSGGKLMCPGCRAKRKIIKAARRDRDYSKLATQIKNNKNLNSDIFGVIYKVVCKTNNKIYIGQSVNFKARKNEHIRNALKSRSFTPFSSALRRYGKDKFNWELIHACADKNELNYWERYYINQYDSLCGKNGYNILDGVVN